MDHFFRAIVIGTLFSCGSAWAGENSDVSLSREVDKYLEKSASKWDDPSTLRPHWSNGLVFRSSDGSVKIKVGGRLMWDSFWGTQGSGDFGGNKLDAAGSGTYFRRVRLYMSGTVYSRTTFKVQVEFGKGDLAIKDVYVGLKGLWGSEGDLLLGHAKEPFSLSQMASSKNILLVERPMVVDAFAPFRNAGVFLFSRFAKKRIYASGSATWENTNGTGSAMSGGGGGAFTLRVAGLAIRNKEKKTLLHLGFSGSYRNFGDSTERYRARPNLGDKERVVDTGNFAAKSAFIWDFELLLIWRSVEIASEFLGSQTSGIDGGESHSFWGWYVELGWWITGESKNYSTKTFSVARTAPKRNFRDGSGGWGAWQLVLRYDYLDLNDKSVAGGEVSTLAVGLTWRWNPNTRMMFNLVYADVQSFGQAGNGVPAGSSGELFIFVIRVQFDF